MNLQLETRKIFDELIRDEKLLLNKKDFSLNIFKEDLKNVLEYLEQEKAIIWIQAKAKESELAILKFKNIRFLEEQINNKLKQL